MIARLLRWLRRGPPLDLDALCIWQIRVRSAKQALVDTGYFRPDEVGDDIAPRIRELAEAYRSSLEQIQQIALDT